MDPSVEGLHAKMIDAYAGMNGFIARDRALYGLTLQATHLSASRTAITETSLEALRRTRQGEERTAIILGAGGCGDIPLEQLLTDFDKTTVVDVDTERTERALSNLPSKLLGKVTLVQAELSGLATGVSSIFEQASKESEFSRFLSTATTLVRQLDVVKSQVEFGKSYAFVCSQLLMTQLSSIPLMRFDHLVGEKYGKSVAVTPANKDEELVIALNEKNVHVQTSHISYLSRLTRDSGTVHFADTLGSVVGGQILHMVPPSVLDAIEDNFDHIREPDFWYYRASPIQKFAVGSYALAPKPAT